MKVFLTAFLTILAERRMFFQHGSKWFPGETSQKITFYRYLVFNCKFYHFCVLTIYLLYIIAYIFLLFLIFYCCALLSLRNHIYIYII